MTAIVITAAGGPEVLRPHTREVPQPTANQVLIRVHTAGVNRHDCGQRQRGTPPAGATDIPGLEVSGQVVAAGSGVTRWQPGALVVALVNGGGYAEYCIAEARLTLPKPEQLDELGSAALPEALFTVWHNLFEICRLQPGEWLLVHGGASGVGTIAIQLARHFGAFVIATAGSAEKCDVSKQLGAHEAANYNEEDFVAVAKVVTHGRGVDVILDMTGGLYAERNLDALAPDGRITHLTSAHEPRFNVPIHAILQKRAVITGSMLRPLPIERKAAVADELWARVWPLLGRSINPVIDSVFPLEGAAQAHERMEAGRNIGKILLDARAPASRSPHGDR